ncbi:hypothetical protein [Hyphomicrobium sp. 99]|uniref:hypothetical protein n=1 Tax=Hyphomicrobium sp. 99 TaxID=1163419 RepID=UPI0012E087AB|nr:hypothetical protein [Hyphomicrobium sp. 99]
MKKSLMLIAAVTLFASPVYAQTRLRSPTMGEPTAPLIRTPSSSLPGAGITGSIPSPTTSTYPKPIKQNYDPLFNDPTQRNPNLRNR